MPSSNSVIRVLIVDDHLVVRAGLRVLLGPHQDIEIVGEAGDGAAAIALVEELGPDVVTLETALSDVVAIRLAQHIRALKPNWPRFWALLLGVQRGAVLFGRPDPWSERSPAPGARR